MTHRQDRAKRRSELRAVIFDFAHGICEWTACGQPATELAHMTSKGAGGSKYRDIESNVFAACPAHARVSDGLAPPGGGTEERNTEYGKVPGALPRGDSWKTRDVMEALREHLNQTRN